MVGKQTVEMNQQTYEMAGRAAALDGIDVAKYLEGIVWRDAEHTRTREFIEGPSSGGDHNRNARLAA